MTEEKILSDLKKKNFKPVYWLEGDENFFIDEIVDFAAANLLSESEASFNLTVLYGKDTDWATLYNTCRRYPMFSERQVVIVKEAQEMRSIEKLESYIEKPLLSTLLFIAYKGKKVDKRTKLAKLLKEKAILLTTKKLYDNELPEWTSGLIKSKGLTINNKGLQLLIDHIGNDLNRLNNEIDKLALNLGSGKAITEDAIEKYVGISKEFNVYELQNAVAYKDFYKAMRMVRYFEDNPKAAPLQLIFPSLYGFFSKVLVVFTIPGRDEKAIASGLGISPFFARDYLQAANRYGQQGIEKIILLLHAYNLKSLGVNDAGTDDMSLLKELLAKIMHD
ncbi:MAG TPA: DNA polymerase III subunit delta [Chitinophagaceae bacterium]|nr:DNA polymerase III subunit delta [Chitinophagaceae bacterium]